MTVRPSHITDLIQSNDDFSNYTLFELHNFTFSDLIHALKEHHILLHLWIWPLFFWITFVIGIGGNWMVVYVILKKKQMRTVTNIFLLNLAIADILYLITAIPSITYWTDYWPCGEFMCKYYFVFVSQQFIPV